MIEKSMSNGTMDEVGASILYEGANLSQLGELFRCDERVLKRKMHGIKPVGKRHKALIYRVDEVAAVMGKLTPDQVDAAMLRLNPADLPKLVSKEYWNAQRARQAFMEKEGDLWPTLKVITTVGEMVKSLKMELDLLTDGVERSTELSDRQRELITELVDGAKMNMMRRLKEDFVVKPPSEAPKDLPDVEDFDDPKYDVSDL